MARTKAVQPAVSLQNLSICFAASTIPSQTLSGRSLDVVKTEISNRGGSYTTKVDQATHLVVSDAQYQKRLAKVKEAIDNNNVQIVSFDWLEATFNSSKPVDESSYLLHTVNNGSAPTSKKRSRDVANDDDDDNDDDQTANTSNAKKAKPTKKTGTKGAKAKKLKEEETEADSKDDLSNGTLPNVTKNVAINVPLDEHLPPEMQNAKVYVKDDSTIYDVTLNQSNAGKNANKFYRMQLLEDKKGTWSTWTRWGRVGEHGQTAMIGPDSFEQALSAFNKKFKDKTGNTWDDRNAPQKSGKYVFIERNYEDSDGEDDDNNATAKSKASKEEGKEEEEEVQSKLPAPVQNLMKIIFNKDYFNNTFSAFDYDARKMPLGKLSKTTLMRGYEVLKQLAGLVGASGDYDDIADLSNQYLSIIPHVVGRGSRPPVLDNMNMIKKEIDLLEALTDMQLANEVMKSAKQGKEHAEAVNLLDRQYEGLGMQEMTPLDVKSSEFSEIQKYLTGTIGYTHGMKYKVQDIFRIERQGEYARFDSSKFAKISNSDRRLLWHGSRCTNFGGILSQGLRIAPPEAPVSGYMFGKGVYLADMSSKSANYCNSYTSGGIGLLLLCEAELGKPPLKLTGSDYEAGSKAVAQGSISTWGVGNTAPKAWKDASCIHKSLKGVQMPDVVKQEPGATNEPNAYLQYNEYICYDIHQIRLRYLLRVEM